MVSHRHAVVSGSTIAALAIATLALIACTDTTRPLTRQEALLAATAAKVPLTMTYFCGTTFKVSNSSTAPVEAVWRVLTKSDSGAIIVPQKVGTTAGVGYFSTDSTGSVQLAIDTTIVTTLATGTKSCSIHLLTTVGPGVTGHPTKVDSAVAKNKKVTYSYTLQQGYKNLLVTVDGNFVPASGTITMDSTHVLIASADPILTLPADLQSLYTQERAVLTASDPVAAMQSLIDAEVQYSENLDLPTADAKLALLDFLAIDDSANAAAILRVSTAIQGHAFEIAPNGTILAAQRTRRLRESRASGVAPARTRRSIRFGVSTDSSHLWEPTDFIFSNGIHTNAAGVHNEALLLRKLLKPEFPTMDDTLTGAVRLQWVVNYPYANQQPPTSDQLAFCYQTVFSYVHRSFVGQNSGPGYIAKCMQDTTYRRMRDHDIIEAAQQWLGLIVRTPINTVDSDSLFAQITASRTLGRHVILIGYSQGNLVSLQALTELIKGSNPYNRQTDSLCVAALSIASPTSNFWGSLLPTHYLQHVVEAGDIVADEPTNMWPRTTTDSTLFYVEQEYAFPLVNPLLYNPLIAGTRLHFLETYVNASPTNTLIFNEADSLYNACATDSLNVTPQSVPIKTGTTSALTVVAKNGYGDTLPNRAIKYAVLTPAVDTIDSTGVISGRTVGSDSAIVSRYRVRVSIPVTVSKVTLIDTTSKPGFAIVDASGTWVSGSNTLVIDDAIQCTVPGCLGLVTGTYTGPPLLAGTQAKVSGSLMALSSTSNGWPVSGQFTVTFPSGTPGNPNAPPGQPWNDTWTLTVFPLNSPNPEMFFNGCDLSTCPLHLFEQ